MERKRSVLLRKPVRLGLRISEPTKIGGFFGCFFKTASKRKTRNADFGGSASALIFPKLLGPAADGFANLHARCWISAEPNPVAK